MIKILFGKHLLSCDFPGCKKYLPLKGAADADRALKEKGWMILTTDTKIIFLCGPCQGKAANMTKPEWEKIKEVAHTVTK